MVQRVERWTCDQRVVGSNPTRGKAAQLPWASCSHLCASVTKQYNLVPAKGPWCSSAGKVTAGLAESNGSLPPGGWLIVTCGLTDCTLGSAPGPTLGNEYGKHLPSSPILKVFSLTIIYNLRRINVCKIGNCWTLRAIASARTGRGGSDNYRTGIWEREGQ